jgi:hypothetical protein
MIPPTLFADSGTPCLVTRVESPLMVSNLGFYSAARAQAHRWEAWRHLHVHRDGDGRRRCHRARVIGLMVSNIPIKGL